jgi:hypothetical protein
MTKQEKIREAYGEHFESVKDYVDENGWCDLSIMPLKWKISEINDIDIEDFTWFRPKSLAGIEKYYSFKKINNFEFYEVNILGVVKSIERNTIQKNGKNYKVSEKIMLPQIDSHGYIVFGLRKNKETKKVYLHRILAESFIPNPENKPCVNHKDGVKYNNSLENLEWCTYQENNIHAFDNGLQKRGKEHHFYGKKGKNCHNHKDYQPIIKPKPPIY